MKYKKIKTLDGKIIEQAIPENEEDEKHLEKMDIEVPGSFGDDEDQEETTKILGFD